MKRSAAIAACLAVLALSGCGGTAMVRYNDGKDANAGEYTFVVPRTVIRIEAAAPKASGDGKAAAAPAKRELTFTSVPLPTDDNGKDLPKFSIKDDSSSGFTWVPTSVTSVTYADQLIIQSIGTAITDNRKAVIESVFGVLGTVAGVKAKTADDCKKATIEEFKPFVVADFTKTEISRMESNPCWGYSIQEAKEAGGTSSGAFAMDGGKGIPLDTKVPWFPYPACKYYRIVVAKCRSAEGACSPGDEQKREAVVARSDGTQYRRIAFPPKGKISMHADFCAADVTSDPSPLSSDWEIANQVLTSTKALLKPSSSGTQQQKQ